MTFDPLPLDFMTLSKQEVAMSKFRFMAVICLCSAAIAQAPAGKLVGPSELQQVIAQGTAERGQLQGVELYDNWAYGGDRSSGFRLVLHTPLAWIKQKASDASKEYRPFTVGDVTDDMRQHVLRVVVYPSTPRRVVAGGLKDADSAQHVIVRDVLRQRVVQPTQKDTFMEDVQNAMGAKVQYQGVSALFPIAEIEKLRDANDEFFVTVVGESSERDFKIKRKHLARLPFDRIEPAPVQGIQPIIQPPSPDPSASALVVVFDECLADLKKLDAAFKVGASEGIVSAKLIDVQLHFDVLRQKSAGMRLPRTMESVAVAFDAFKRARNPSSENSLRYARDALKRAEDNLAAFKMSGKELPTRAASPQKD